jgi:tetratricopeptide (TPR) repeat protein/predicted aspartyl protease
MPVSRFGLIPILLILPLSAVGADSCKLGVLELPVTMEGLRPLVRAKINGTEARFLADSGAFYSMLSPAAAAQFKLPKRSAPFGTYVLGVGGGGITPEIATVQTFTLSNFDLHKVEFLVGGNELGAGAVGLLGQNLIRIWDVEYDLANGMLRLVKPENCGKRTMAYWATASQPIAMVEIRTPTAAKPQPTGLALVNGVEVRVAFDTGSPFSMLSLSAAKRAGITTNSVGVRPAGETHGGFGSRTVEVWVAPLANFKVGGEEIQHTQVLIADLQLQDFDMLLGDDFFLSHRVYVANGQGRLYFTYNGGPVFALNDSRRAPSAPPIAANSSSTPDSSSTPPSSPPPPSDANAARPVDPEVPPTSVPSAGTVDRTDQPRDAAGFMRRGTAYAARKDFEHALADLQRAYELAPREADYYYELGRVQWQSGQPAPALQAFDKALELKPDHVAAGLARAQLRLIRHADVKADLDAIDRFAAPEDTLRLRLGGLYEAIGQFSAAIHQYDLWINAHQGDAALAGVLNARCWVQAEANQNLDRALSDCNAALRLQPKRAAFLDSRGLVRLRRGEFDRSISDYDAALALEPGLPSSLFGRGLAKLRKGLQAQGSADLAAATAIQPSIADRFAGFGVSP